MPPQRTIFKITVDVSPVHTVEFEGSRRQAEEYARELAKNPLEGFEDRVTYRLEPKERA